METYYVSEDLSGLWSDPIAVEIEPLAVEIDRLIIEDILKAQEWQVIVNENTEDAR